MGSKLPARTLWSLFALLIACSVMVSINRSCSSNLPPVVGVAKSDKAGSPPSSDSGTAKTPLSNPLNAPDNAEQAGPYPLAMWEGIPDRWALWPQYFEAPKDNEKFNAAKSGSFERLLDLLQQDEMVVGPEAADRLQRALGLLVTLDYALATELGLKAREETTISNPKYFPNPALLGIYPPGDKSPMITKLIELAQSDFTPLAEKIPDQYKGQLTEAFKTRALLLLAAIGDGQTESQWVREQLSGGSPRVRAAAAFAMASHDDSTEASRILANPKDPALASLLAAMGGYKQEVRRLESGQKDSFLYGTSKSLRSLDSALLASARLLEGTENYHLAISTMAVRVDNPEIRAYVLDVLRSSEDPSLARAIVSTRPDIRNDVEYSSALRRWYGSENEELRTWARQGMRQVRDEGVVQLILPELHNPKQNRDLKGAMSILARNAPTSASTILPALSDFISRWPDGEKVPEPAHWPLDAILRDSLVDPLLKSKAQELKHALRQRAN